MSTVELAVTKVRKLSNRQARELLGWLAERQSNGSSRTQPVRSTRRKTGVHPAMKKLKAWEDSIRFTTDWQPPRMPTVSSNPTSCEFRARHERGQ